MEPPTDIRDRCIAYLEGGRLAEADDLASGAVVRWPEDGPLWRTYGLIRYRRGAFAAACSALETAGLLVPLTPAARCALADCYARTGRDESARDLYRDLAEDGRCPTVLLPAVAAGLGSLGLHGIALAT